MKNKRKLTLWQKFVVGLGLMSAATGLMPRNPMGVFGRENNALPQQARSPGLDNADLGLAPENAQMAYLKELAHAESFKFPLEATTSEGKILSLSPLDYLHKYLEVESGGIARIKYIDLKKASILDQPIEDFFNIPADKRPSFRRRPLHSFVLKIGKVLFDIEHKKEVPLNVAPDMVNRLLSDDFYITSVLIECVENSLTKGHEVHDEVRIIAGMAQAITQGKLDILKTVPAKTFISMLELARNSAFLSDKGFVTTLINAFIKSEGGYPYFDLMLKHADFDMHVYYKTINQISIDAERASDKRAFINFLANSGVDIHLPIAQAAVEGELEVLAIADEEKNEYLALSDRIIKEISHTQKNLKQDTREYLEMTHQYELAYHLKKRLGEININSYLEEQKTFDPNEESVFYRWGKTIGIAGAAVVINGYTVYRKLKEIPQKIQDKIMRKREEAGKEIARITEEVKDFAESEAKTVAINKIESDFDKFYKKTLSKFYKKLKENNMSGTVSFFNEESSKAIILEVIKSSAKPILEFRLEKENAEKKKQEIKKVERRVPEEERAKALNKELASTIIAEIKSKANSMVDEEHPSFYIKDSQADQASIRGRASKICREAFDEIATEIKDKGAKNILQNKRDNTLREMESVVGGRLTSAVDTEIKQNAILRRKEAEKNRKAQAWLEQNQENDAPAEPAPVQDPAPAPARPPKKRKKHHADAPQKKVTNNEAHVNKKPIESTLKHIERLFVKIAHAQKKKQEVSNEQTAFVFINLIIRLHEEVQKLNTIELGLAGKFIGTLDLTNMRNAYVHNLRLPIQVIMDDLQYFYDGIKANYLENLITRDKESMSVFSWTQNPKVWFVNLADPLLPPKYKRDHTTHPNYNKRHWIFSDFKMLLEESRRCTDTINKIKQNDKEQDLILLSLKLQYHIVRLGEILKSASNNTQELNKALFGQYEEILRLRNQLAHAKKISLEELKQQAGKVAEFHEALTASVASYNPETDQKKKQIMPQDFKPVFMNVTLSSSSDDDDSEDEIPSPGTQSPVIYAKSSQELQERLAGLKSAFLKLMQAYDTYKNPEPDYECFYSSTLYMAVLSLRTQLQAIEEHSRHLANKIIAIDDINLIGDILVYHDGKFDETDIMQSISVLAELLKNNKSVKGFLEASDNFSFSSFRTITGFIQNKLRVAPNAETHAQLPADLREKLKLTTLRELARDFNETYQSLKSEAKDHPRFELKKNFCLFCIVTMAQYTESLSEVREKVVMQQALNDKELETAAELIASLKQTTTPTIAISSSKKRI